MATLICHGVLHYEALERFTPPRHFPFGVLFNEATRTIRDYYFKRLLRIGPAYYLTIFIGAFVLGIPEIRDHLFWHLMFFSNFFIVQVGYWPLAISHYWSLSVQEQFYLIWPWLVLLLPRRWFMAICLLLIPFAQIYCVWMIVLGAPAVTRWVLLPGCIDSFAYGALAAYLVQMEGARKVFSGWCGFLVFLVAVTFLVFGAMLRWEPETSAALGFVEMFEGVFLVWLLAAVYFSENNWVAKILTLPPLLVIGRFSYGLYIYHIFVIILYERISHAMAWSEPSNIVRVPMLLIISLLFAAASHHWIEEPVLSLWKRRHRDSPAA